MFYTSSSVDKLMTLIGWAEPIPPTDIVLTDDNKQSDSGDYWNDYNKMATVEIVKSLMPKSTLDGATPVSDVNPELVRLRRGAAKKLLNAIFNSNPRAYFNEDAFNQRCDTSDKDFDPIIAAQAPMFVEALGYQMAIDVMMLILSSNRSNFEQRIHQEQIADIRAELDGYTDPVGKVISTGVRGQLRDATERLIDILFPKESPNFIRNASRVW